MSRATFGVDRRYTERVQIDIQQSIKVKPTDKPKLETGMKDFDDVLGGGLTLGANLILGSEPGVGKSTLMRQMLKCAANRGNRGLYVSAEESAGQARNSMDRIGAVHSEVFLTETTDFRRVIDLIYKYQPRIVVVDSLQEMHDPQSKGEPGGKLQLNAIMRLLKTLPDELAFIFIGHSTKAGKFAGTQTVKHVMDQVVWMLKDEMDPNIRPLRPEKNRFGTTAIERSLIMGPRGFCNYGKDDPRKDAPNDTTGVENADNNVEEDTDGED